MVEALPKKHYRKDVNPLDLLEYRQIRINPPRPKSSKLGDRQLQSALCNRCNMKVSFYSMRGNINEEEEKADRKFVRSALQKHLKDIHGEPKDVDTEKLLEYFMLVNVQI